MQAQGRPAPGFGSGSPRLVGQPVPLKERRHPLLQLAVGGARAVGELERVADVEAGVGEREPRERVVHVAGEGVTRVETRGHVDAEPAERYEIAVEAANVELESRQEQPPGLRAVPEKGEKLVQPGGPLSGQGGGRRPGLLPRHDTSGRPRSNPASVRATGPRAGRDGVPGAAPVETWT